MRVHIEALLRPESRLDFSTVREALERVLARRSLTYREGDIPLCEGTQGDGALLQEHCLRLTLQDTDNEVCAVGTVLLF